MAIRNFPPGFLWGAATASFQIEGATREDGRGPSIWDTFCATPGKVFEGHTGDPACDHYHRWRDDVALMRDLGLAAYRFSVAWPRIQPEGHGPAHARGLDFYSRLVDALLEAGIQPVPTLYHWDLPQALEDAGGWPAIDTAGRFSDFAGIMADALGDRVDTWITLNEPWVSAVLGYWIGVHAPGRTDLDACLQAGHTLMVAHGLAAQQLRARVPRSRVGITVNVAPNHPATDSEADREAAERADAASNRWFLDPIYAGAYPEAMREAYGAALPEFTETQVAAVRAPIDFIGLNYYTRSVIRHDEQAGPTRAAVVPPSGVPVTAMDWEVYPDGLRQILRCLSDLYGAPLLYVTENGAAYDDVVRPDGTVDDGEREAYLEAHLAAVHQALEEGVQVGGYFAWSLLDNFEWAMGYSKRFGLVHVDYQTQRRTPKRSALWYAGVVRANALGG